MKTLSKENQEHRNAQYRAKASAKWRMFWNSSEKGTYRRGDEHRTAKERLRNEQLIRESRAAS